MVPIVFSIFFLVLFRRVTDILQMEVLPCLEKNIQYLENLQ